MASGTRNVNASRHSLFDAVVRDPARPRDHSTTAFDGLSLSIAPAAAEARRVLDEWYSRIPPTKQGDIRGRFRRDDRQHSGALLELLMHELLWRLCDNVEMGPTIDGQTPDFRATHSRIDFFVECTVAQESDKEFGALRREQNVLDIIQKTNAAPYGFFFQPVRVGSSEVPRKHLTRFLEGEVQKLKQGSRDEDDLDTLLQGMIEWEWEDWRLRFWPVHVGESLGSGTNVMSFGGAYLIEEAATIGRSLENKADAYTELGRRYLIVATQRAVKADEEDLSEELLSNTATSNELSRFFGSPSAPRNQHVSAVLYKRNLSSAWDIQNRWNRSTENANQDRVVTDWYLVHHPTAKQSFPHGVFPFATEYVWKSGWNKYLPATRTVNDVLGLPNPWPEVLT